MCEIKCKNYQSDSDISAVTFILKDKQSIAIVSFKDDTTKHLTSSAFLKNYKASFNHPILNQNAIEVTGKPLIIEYNNLAEFLNLPKLILYTFILFYPSLQKIIVKPTKHYLEHHIPQFIPIKMKKSESRLSDIQTKKFNQLIKLDNLEKEFSYTNGFIVNGEFTIDNLAIFSDDDLDFEQDNSILDLLNGSEFPVYLRYINPYVGFGVFAETEITAGQYIGIYNGEFDFARSSTDYQYMYALNQDPFHKHINARMFGSFSRFINHTCDASINKLCGQYDFPTSEAYKENIIPEHRVYNGYEFILFKAKHNIKPHQQLLFNYGDDYWAEDSIQHIFLKNNRCLANDGQIYKDVACLPKERFDLLGSTIKYQSFWQRFYRPFIGLIMCSMLLLFKTYR